MKVARVTVTAMIQGLSADRSPAFRRRYAGRGWWLPQCSSLRRLLAATRDRTVSSNACYDAVSDRSVAQNVGSVAI